MESVMMMNSTADNRHWIGNPTRNFATNGTLFPYPSDNLLLASFLAGGHFTGGGLLSMPPASLSHSYPPPVSVFRAPQNFHHYRQQPPLLPLPISMPLNHQNMNIDRSYSSLNTNIRLSPPRINKNVKTRGRDHSLTPKKSKNQKKVSKKEVRDLVSPATTEEKQAPPMESSISNMIGPDPKDLLKEIVISRVRDLVPPATTEEKQAPPTEIRKTESSISEMIGPDPKDLPKEIVISKVFSSSINKSGNEFSGSAVFTPSPPPSSLPLPTFSLRSKVNCKAQACAVTSGVDVGATDNLRRLLRI